MQFQWQIQIRELRNTRIKSGWTILSPFSIRCTVRVLDSKASVLLITFFKCCKLYKNYYCVLVGKSARTIIQFWVINEFQTCDKRSAVTLFYIEYKSSKTSQYFVVAVIILQLTCTAKFQVFLEFSMSLFY